MKFLHSADWQLGMVFGREQSKASALRQARLDTIKSVLALAQAEKVDFIVVAGDVLEDNRVEHRWVRDLAAILKGSPVPVYLLPGNHDPLTPDSPYNTHPELFEVPIVVLRDETPVTVAGGTLWPCPARAKRFDGNPVCDMPGRRAENGIRVGIAHGPMHGTPDECGYHIPRDSAERHELDYLAVGHWHRAAEEGPRLWYSGTHEPCKFGEGGGDVLVVDIAAPGQPPRVTTKHVARFEWLEMKRTLSGESDIDELTRELDALGAPEHKVVRLILDGQLPPELLGRVDALEETHGARLFLLEVDNGVLPARDVTYRHPLLARLATRLAERGAAEPETARRALAHLATLVTDSGDKELR